MLHLISWKMYGISLLVALLFYYGYVSYTHRRLLRILLRRLWATVKKEGPEPKKNGVEETEKGSVGKSEVKGQEGKKGSAGTVPLAILLTMLLPMAAWAQTADGAAGINQANSMIRSYFDPAVNLMYAAGALAGIYGGYKVYKSMSDKHGDGESNAAKWFAGCIFLVLVATVLKSFFGI